MADNSSVTDDEIDLRKVWETILKNQLLILFTTLLMGTGGILYTAKIESVYHGEVLIEIGDIVLGSSEATKPTVIIPIENANDLTIILAEMMASTKFDITIDVPGRSTRLIRIVSSNPDQQTVRKGLEKAVALVLARHKAKMDCFKNINAVIDPTVIIDSIKVENEPKKAQKSYIIIIALVVGLMIGMLLSFFREYMSNSK